MSMCWFTELINQRQCAGSEDGVAQRIAKLAEEWEYLTTKSSEKSEKLKEANRQRMYTAAVKDLEFWLGEVTSIPILWVLRENSIVLHILIFPLRNMENGLIFVQLSFVISQITIPEISTRFIIGRGFSDDY